MNYYRKNVDNTANDLKLKMQIGSLTVKMTENINKINDLLEVDKDIKKNITDNSNSIKNMKNEIDNYYDKNEIDLKFGDLYNKTYIDHKLDDIYDKTEINSINSKLNRNIVLFNTNLTNHIDKYSNEKKNIDEDIKENKDNLKNFITNTFTNLNNTQNSRLTDLEESKLTETQSNKLEELENLDLNKINSSYNFAVFNKTKLDKIRYYIKEFIPFNITIIKKFTFIGDMDELMILQFELDQREFSVDDIINYNINVNFQYDDSKFNWYRLKMRFDILYDDDSIISSFNKMLVSKGFFYYHLINFNINKFIKINKITSKIIFKIYLVKNNTSLQDDIVVTITNNYESNYCDITHYTIL